jgi:recombination protein RecA
MPIPTELPRTTLEKAKAAQSAVENIEKQYGKGSILKLGNRVNAPVPCIATGIYDVDNNVFGVGGAPKGRIIEIYGPEAGGKTTLLLNLIATAQKEGGLCALIDAENAFGPTWASTNGVKVDDLFVSQPNSGEEALEIAQELIASGAFAVVGIDSVAALVPQAELDGEMGDSHMGLQARLMSQALRKLTSLVNKTGTILVFINQVRDKIGVMYGSPETTTGGRALKFYSSVRLDVRRISAIKEGDEVIGNKVRIKGAKNKVSAPFREAEVDLLFASGFDAVGSLFDKAVEMGLIEKSGSWFNHKGGERIGQGRSTCISIIKQDAKTLTQLTKKVVEEANGTHKSE